MKTFMAQCPTVLPLCYTKSTFVLEQINLYIIRWEVIFAWREKSALGNALEMGMVLLPSEERRGEQWNERFYCYSAVFSPQWAVARGRSGPCMPSLQGRFDTKFSRDVIALRVLGDTVSVPAVTTTPKGCAVTNLGFLWRFLWILLKIQALDAVAWARQLLEAPWARLPDTLWPGLIGNPGIPTAFWTSP